MRERSAERHGACLSVPVPPGIGLGLSVLLGNLRQADVTVDPALHGTHQALPSLAGVSSHSGSNKGGMDTEVRRSVTNAQQTEKVSHAITPNIPYPWPRVLDPDRARRGARVRHAGRCLRADLLRAGRSEA